MEGDEASGSERRRRKRRRKGRMRRLHRLRSVEGASFSKFSWRQNSLRLFDSQCASVFSVVQIECFLLTTEMERRKRRERKGGKAGEMGGRDAGERGLERKIGK